MAFKLILPTVFWTNQFLIEHLNSLNTCIKSISEPLPTTDITEFAAGLFDIYNCSHHLIIYCPLSTVIARQNNNFQLHAGIVELMQSVINATQQLMKVEGNLLVNAAIDAIGIAGIIRTECKVYKQFKEHLKYKTVEGLINGGLTWILASFPEFYLDTEFVKDEVALRAAVNFLLSYFCLFLSPNELEAAPENSSMTIYKFSLEKSFT